MRERRHFPADSAKSLKKIAALAAAAEIGISGFGAIPAKAETLGVRAEATLQQVETRLSPQIEGEIKKYEAQKTALTESEIKNELSRCVFLEGNPTVSTFAPPKHPGEGLFGEWEARRKAMYAHATIARANIPETSIAIVQTQFSTGDSAIGAFYIPALKTIFINQIPENPALKRQQLEFYLIASAPDIARETLEKDRKRGLISRQDVRTRVQNIEVAVRSALAKKDPRLSDLPSPFLAEYAKGLAREARIYRWHREESIILTHANLPHEAFHHFYEHQLGEQGYEGPHIDEILTVALRAFFKRFGDDPDPPEYGKLIKEAIEDYTGKDFPQTDEEMTALSTLLAQKFDLRREPSDMPLDEWKSLPDYQKNELDAHKKIMNFLTEYLARIYGGALGNTPERIKEKLLESHAVFLSDSDPVPYKLDHIFHAPTDEELALLRSMKWNGQPIVP